MRSWGKSSASTPNKKPPPVPALCPDTVLAGRLHTLLAELNMAEPQEHPASLALAPAGDTAAILSAIEHSRSSLLSRMDKLTKECNLIRPDLDRILGRLTESENRVSATEDLTTGYTQRITELELELTVKALVAKSDAENASDETTSARIAGGCRGGPPC